MGLVNRLAASALINSGARSPGAWNRCAWMSVDDALEVRESEVYCSRPSGVMLRRQCGLQGGGRLVPGVDIESRNR
jgi:hypothetical protein